MSAFSAGEVGDASASFHSSVAFSGEPLDVKRQQQKKPKLDLAFEPAFDDGESSGRARANVMHDEAAQALYDFMDAEAKERYMRGFDKLPGETGEKLILRTFRGWGPGTLKGALSALRRLGRWLSTKFGSVYSFRVEPAMVGWFLMENLVDDDDAGHTSKNLEAGLRFAASTLKYPIDVCDDAVKALSRGPRKSPKQAPSASVRVAYHFWSVAMNDSYSVPLRAMAGAFLVMCLCGLRSIDAQRSSFDVRVGDTGNGWGLFLGGGVGFEVEDCDAMGVSVDYFWQVRQVAVLSSVGVGRFRFYVPFVAAWREAGELVGDGEVSGVSVLYFEVFARNPTASFDCYVS